MARTSATIRALRRLAPPQFSCDDPPTRTRIYRTWVPFRAPDAVGIFSSDLTELDVWPDETWPAEILDAGDAVIDGHFVVDVLERDREGRPTLVLAVYLAYPRLNQAWLRTGRAVVVDPHDRAGRILRFLHTALHVVPSHTGQPQGPKGGLPLR